MLRERREQREQPRFPINAGGRIVFADGEASLRCRVWNLSENTALLRLTDKDWSVPNTFELHIDGALRHVWVIWRENDNLAVAWD